MDLVIMKVLQCIMGCLCDADGLIFDKTLSLITSFQIDFLENMETLKNELRTRNGSCIFKRSG
jgi:hypothetical protein